MIMKIIAILLLITIIYCLFSAARFMISHKSKPRSMVKALTWRISLSFFLFILLLVGYGLGWMHPHTILQQMSNLPR